MDYLRALRRSYLLVLLCVIACGVGAFVAVNRVTPKYTATAELIVSGSSNVGTIDEIAARELAAARAASFSPIASTAPALADAVQAAGFSAGEGSPSVSASAPMNDPFLYVSITSTDPKIAAGVANAYVKSLPATVVRLDSVPESSKIILSVLTPASVPSSPSSPDKKRDTGVGLGIGLLVGVGLALVREVADKTLRDSDGVAEASGLRLLGVVPYELPNERLISETHPRGIRTEAYRQVRTALLAYGESAPARRLVVTSGTAGEGKTSLISNLAKVYARAGHRVVVVDADLRRPKVGEYFGLPKAARGLTDVLLGTASLNDAVALLDEGRLGVLPAGDIPANPAEALGGLAMEAVIASLSEDWEIVLIDTPPVLPVADALVLASRVDGVILVARLGETSADKMRRALAAIAKVNASVVGVVANGAKASDDSAYRYVYGRGNRNTGSYIDVVPADAKTLPAEAEPLPQRVVAPTASPRVAPVAKPGREPARVAAAPASLSSLPSEAEASAQAEPPSPLVRSAATTRPPSGRDALASLRERFKPRS